MELVNKKRLEKLGLGGLKASLLVNLSINFYYMLTTDLKSVAWMANNSDHIGVKVKTNILKDIYDIEPDSLYRAGALDNIESTIDDIDMVEQRQLAYTHIENDFEQVADRAVTKLLNGLIHDNAADLLVAAAVLDRLGIAVSQVLDPIEQTRFSSAVSANVI